MKLIIDAFDAISGWTAGTGATINGVNDVTEFIAGNQAHSIDFGFSLKNGYVQKLFAVPIDVSEYTELSVNIMSTLRGNMFYRSKDDFIYKMDLGSGKEYYIPNFSAFTDFVIDISDIATIERIKITALSDGLDYLVMSYMVASQEEIPLDIFQGVKEQLEADISANYATKYFIGTVTASAGDTEIDMLVDAQFIRPHVAIVISGGGNSEIHQIDTMSGNKFKFKSTYAGKSLLHSYTGGNVYLHIPVEYGRYDTDVVLPSICIWNLSGDPVFRRSDTEHINDTWKTTDQTGERQVGRDYSYPLLVDCEALSSELLAVLSKIVRDFIARNVVWVNGRKFPVKMIAAPTFVEPTESHEIIPKMQFTIDVELREDSFARSYLPILVQINATYEVTT
jgi:hypothetical protein